MNVNLGVSFDGQPGLSFAQGEDRKIIIRFFNKYTGDPIDITGFQIGVNFPQYLGGTVKRYSGGISFNTTGVTLTPAMPTLFTLVNHGLVTGDTLRFATQSGGSSLPTGLLAATNYLVVVTDVNNFTLTDTSANPIICTTVGVGIIQFTLQGDVVITNATLGQTTLTLRNAVSQVIENMYGQDFQAYWVDATNLIRILSLQGLLDVITQPDPTANPLQ